MTTAQLSPSARQLLEDTYGRINTIDSLLRLKDRVLSRADLKQLGPDLYAAFRQIGVTGIWMKLRGCTLTRAVIEIASALDGFSPATRAWLLREAGETVDDSAAAIDRAVQAAALVLLDRPRTAYFHGAKVDVEWDNHSASWEYLELLARAGMAGEKIDCISLKENASPKLPVHRKYNLGQLKGMPEQLVNLIVSAGRSTQQLDLPAAQIRIFEHVANDEYREWRP